MKNQLVNFVEVNFEEVKSFFYNQEREIIIEEFENSKVLILLLDGGSNFYSNFCSILTLSTFACEGLLVG